MGEIKLPNAWELFINRNSFLPVIVKSLEKIHDVTWSMEPNKHDHFEMVYIKKGSAVFEINGTPVNLDPNDVVIIKPYQSHKFIVQSDAGCEFIVLSFKFQNDDSNRTASNVSIDDFIDFVANDKTGAYITLKLSRKNEIVSVMNRILREREKTNEWGEYLSYLLIMELFVLISRALKQEWELNIRTRTLKLKELLHISKEYMEQNYQKDLSLADVAKYVFLSESYFAHTFKDEFKISPKSYLLKIRIEAAKDLLANTDGKINNVALEVGFSSQQRFNDIFKKHTKLTPLKYRKIEKMKKINMLY